MRRALAVVGALGAAALLAGCGLNSLVSPVPEERVDFTFAVDELRVSVYAEVVLPGVKEVQILWYWGDGETSEGVSAQHVYAAPGLYEITMRVLATFPAAEEGAPPGRASTRQREYTVKKVVRVERRFDLILQGERLPGQWPPLPPDHFYSGQVIYFYLVTKETVGQVTWYFWRVTDNGSILIDAEKDALVVARFFTAGSCGSRECVQYAVTCFVVNADGSAATTLRKVFYVCPPS